MKTSVPLSRALISMMTILGCLSAPTDARAQQSTATIAGQTWTLNSTVGLSPGRASSAIGSSTFDIIPQTVASPFAGISTAGQFTLVSGGSAPFFSDRVDDYVIWARGEFANPALASSQPSADKDGDGASNLFEWLALTDPENQASRLRMEISLLSPDQIRLTLEPYFPASRDYGLLGSTTLSTGIFVEFDSDLGTATGSPPRATQDIPINAGQPARFFKAQISLKP